MRALLARGAEVDVVEPGFDGTPLDWALHAWGRERRAGDYHAVVAQLVRAGAVLRGEPPDRVESDPQMQAALRI